ncbi:MAG: hypothetical protein ACO394_14115, partial [Blastocatellia bacterium]
MGIGLLAPVAFGQDPTGLPDAGRSATESQTVPPASESLVQSVRAALRLRLGYPDLPYAGGLGETTGTMGRRGG